MKLLAKLLRPSFTSLIQVPLLLTNELYLKILTALSFIGGLIPLILGVLSAVFMMDKFGTFLYEMHIAKYMFKDKSAATFNYLEFLRQRCYNFLSAVCKKPDWSTSE